MGACIVPRQSNRNRAKKAPKQVKPPKDIIAHIENIKFGSKLQGYSMLARGTPFWDKCFSCEQKFVSCLFKQHLELCQAKDALKAKQLQLQALAEQSNQSDEALLQVKSLVQQERSALEQRVEQLDAEYRRKAQEAEEADKKISTKLETYMTSRIGEYRVKYEQIPKFGVGAELSGQECPVCLQNFREGEQGVILPCLHLYHAGCLETWFARNKGKRSCLIDKYELL